MSNILGKLIGEKKEVKAMEQGAGRHQGVRELTGRWRASLNADLTSRLAD